MARSDVDQVVPEVCGVSQGGREQLQAYGKVQHLPSIYVPLATQSVLASIQQQSGRNCFLPVSFRSITFHFNADDTILDMY